MTTAPHRRLVLLAIACVLATPSGGSADADRDGDHERARRALSQGHARPLAEILSIVRDRLGGEVVGMEFEREDGRYVYEFKIVTPAGRLREVHVDAATAEILGSEDD